MLLTILLIAGLEVLVISSFLLGHSLGRQFERSPKHKFVETKVELSNDVLDPISPEDQLLVKKLEEEAKKYGHSQEE